MDENRFWAIIETGWMAVGGKTKTRDKLVAGKLSEERALALEETLDDVIDAITEELNSLSQEELLAFDRILERKLFDIDRADIHAHTDGSDDGFLYCRGFIVAIGRAYYEAVLADPAKAICDAECEAMCYLSWHLHEEKFGEVPNSGISRESCSNQAGWPSDESPDAGN
ncbi:DUF4240 domain-containing protein [Tuwongella immobilis]|uniref:DUF4240 domain-containing protein n=1 Tax=Tuwongella immobilis TaxID=692036 RepID=A0A6C2YHF4_9BACT|nr:DUF4240 domain-containing protein [Tuwongella immobilis]VIP00958.1 Uncharacterized protein OS=Candidatus Entotheonella sp. TSY1 GN=ETSY1_45025 PE=4 SV=1: DUF4240 [Tuwongella immobilis]VTR97334.1 Uncharacterized protein OS=Candidatus Entotheonella sp. TSY1 GN=ETSY1_45025 PE=4 SV=1: DUF4240 [Tuwongella immobilis]